MEAVQSAVDRGVKQLSGTQAPVANAQPGDIAQQGYAMPARTREDVVQQNPQLLQQPSNIPAPNNQQLVQQGLQVEDNDMFAVLSRAADPAQQRLGQPPPPQAMPQPMREVHQTSGGLILPAGMAPQLVQGVQHEGTDPGHDGDSVSWLL